MSTEPVTAPVDTPEVDLDTFADELFGQSKPAPATTKTEEDSDDSPVEDVNENEVTEEETQDETPEDTAETPEEAPKPKPKPKNSAQERISELVNERNAERQRAAELAARIAQLENPTQNTPAPTLTAGAPTSDSKNEDGTAKYPMGDFDPAYIRDLAVFTVTEQIKEQRKVEEASKAEATAQVQQQALISEWNEKLTPALERYPDFQDKGKQLFDNLSGLDSDYEDYIAATIMQLEYGPDVLYYLTENPDEAQKIVNSGPTKAAVALGRLESKFVTGEVVKRPKVSNAPAPPPSNKGSSAVKPSVAPDTDDLEAFEKALFRKK